jgi:hypothetical protein
MPMLFSPTIGAAIKAGYWFLWVRCPACRTTNAIDLRTLDRHRDAARDRPHSSAVMPFVSAQCAVRRARPTIANQHREPASRTKCGRSIGGASAGGQARLTRHNAGPGLDQSGVQTAQ